MTTNTDKADLFDASPDAPFNLAGEALDNAITPEGEARLRALAESEARKAQEELPIDCICGQYHIGACEIEANWRAFPQHGNTNENAL